MTTDADRGGFARSPRTWLAYVALAAYAYCLYGLGPILALLHGELGLSYTATSAHSALWAAGTIVTGLAFPWLARRLGRRALFWSVSAVSAVGAALFIVGHRLAVTLLAAAVLGTAGTLLQTATLGILADEHGPRRDRAFVESNVGASGAAVLAPLALGGLAATAVGWRVGMLVPIVVLVALAAWFRRLPLPATGGGARGRGPAGRLPGRYWLAAGLVALVVAVEFCLVFYGATMLHVHAGLSTSTAATAMSAFYVAELLGRVAGSRLTAAPGRSTPLTGVSLGVTVAGFALFWLARAPGLAVAGLGVAGLGVANLYPLTVGLAVAAAPGRTDQAAARTQVTVGAAVLAAPLLLGALADRVGVWHAYLIEPALVVLAALALALTVPRGRRSARAG